MVLKAGQLIVIILTLAGHALRGAEDGVRFARFIAALTSLRAKATAILSGCYEAGCWRSLSEGPSRASSLCLRYDFDSESSPYRFGRVKTALPTLARSNPSCVATFLRMFAAPLQSELILTLAAV